MTCLGRGNFIKALPGQCSGFFDVYQNKRKSYRKVIKYVNRGYRKTSRTSCSCGGKGRYGRDDRQGCTSTNGNE